MTIPKEYLVQTPREVPCLGRGGGTGMRKRLQIHTSCWRSRQPGLQALSSVQNSAVVHGRLLVAKEKLLDGLLSPLNKEGTCIEMDGPSLSLSGVCQGGCQSPSSLWWLHRSFSDTIRHKFPRLPSSSLATLIFLSLNLFGFPAISEEALSLQF